jgi:hypothetical protein
MNTLLEARGPKRDPQRLRKEKKNKGRVHWNIC